MAIVRVQWTLQQAEEVKAVLTEIAATRAKVRDSASVKREYTSRGAEGRAEWAEFERKEVLLRGALEELD